MKRLAIVAVVLMMAALWADVASAASYTKLTYNANAPSATQEDNVSHNGPTQSGVGVNYNGSLELWAQETRGFGGLSGDYWVFDVEKEGGKPYVGLYNASVGSNQLSAEIVASSSGKSGTFTASAEWDSTGALTLGKNISGQATPNGSVFAGVASNPATLVFGAKKAHGADTDDLTGVYNFYTTRGTTTITFNGAGGWKNDSGSSGSYASRGDGLYNAGSLWFALSNNGFVLLVDTSAIYAGVGYK